MFLYLCSFFPLIVEYSSAVASYYDIDFKEQQSCTVEQALQEFFDHHKTDKPFCPFPSCKNKLKHVRILYEYIPRVLVIDVEFVNPKSNFKPPLPTNVIKFIVHKVQYTYNLVGRIRFDPSIHHFTADIRFSSGWKNYDDIRGSLTCIDSLDVLQPPEIPNSYWYHYVSEIKL